MRYTMIYHKGSERQMAARSMRLQKHRAYRSVIAEAAEEELDFAEGETHVSGEADEEDAREGVTGIAALAAEALGRNEEPEFFVVADGGGVEAGGRGELADFHFGPS